MIALLTALNIVGLQQSKWTQNLLSAAKVLGLLLVVIIGLTAIPNSATPVESASSGTWGLAMVFVLLSYGGWNEAAYICAEIQDGRRNIVRSLMWSISIITTIYLLINLAYLRGLGLANMAQSEAVAADLMRSLWGEPGALFISVLIAIATLGATNATIFTGARNWYALGQDFSLFGFMGHWQQRPSSPTYALFLQAAIALALVFLGTLTRKGFQTMVDYTAPIFWFFFLLSGISLLVLRIREPHIVRPFRVPFYSLTPLLFCAVCAYLLYSSLVYTVQFVQQDLFNTDFSEATVVTLYLLPEINAKLRPKLLKELKPGTRIVSHAFDMGDWKPQQTLNVEGKTVYYWVVPEQVPANLR